jgi:hypothetical protein
MSMGLKAVKALVLIGSFFLISWGNGAWAFTLDDDLKEGPSLPTSEEITSRNTESLLNQFSRFYTNAFRKTLRDKHLTVAIYFNDPAYGYLMTSNDSWRLGEAEAQARRLAREALYVAIQDTVNDVHLLHRVKEYGRSLTSAEVRMKEDGLDFEGPSLAKAGHGSEAQGHFGQPDFFTSRLMVSAGMDLGLSWRTTLGPVESRLTYLLISDDLVDATLSRKLTRRSQVGLTYRTGTDEQKALITLNFSLP